MTINIKRLDLTDGQASVLALAYGAVLQMREGRNGLALVALAKATQTVDALPAGERDALRSTFLRLFDIDPHSCCHCNGSADAGPVCPADGGTHCAHWTEAYGEGAS